MSRRAALLHPRSAPGFSRPDTAPRYAPDLGIEPTHLDLEVGLDIDTRTLEGIASYRLMQRTHGCRTLSLDAVGFSHVRVEGSQALHSRYDGDHIHILFEEALEVGEEASVTVHWRVESPRVGLVFSGNTAALGESPCMVATDNETERARYWLPCVDHPSVRTTLAIAITADARLQALANGAEQGRTEHDDGTATTRWTLERRCPSYLLCLAVGDFAVHQEEPLDGAPIAAFAPRPFTEAQLARSFGDTRSLITWITKRLDSPLPWPKYYQFAGPRIGGAMENISLVSWDDAFVADERLHAEFGEFIRIVNLHELAHTWFGDLVVCRDFAHSWLKEGWATYMESVWLQETDSVRAATAWLLTDLVFYTEESDTRYARPIVTRRFDSSWDLFDRHLYPGAAWRIHMLRCEVGEEAFWAATRSYLRRHAESVVETDDFRRELEQASGKSLARFFEQWLHAPGYPKLKATWSHDAERGVGTLTAEQTQEDDTKGIGLFDLRLPVALERADGSWVRETLVVSSRTAALTVALAQPPRQVVLDPDTTCCVGLEFDPGLDLLRRTLEDGTSLRGSLHAVQTLAKKGRPDGMGAVLRAYQAEPVPAQRKLYAAALGESGSAAALDGLLALLRLEADPRAMAAVILALGTYQDPRVALALTQWLEQPERPYRATAAALQSLGKQRDPAHVPLLVQYAEAPGWWGWVARGALQGLGENGSPAACAALVSLVQGGSLSHPLVGPALTALGACAKRLPTATRLDVAERLTAFVRHPDHGVRLAAGRGLVALGERSGLGALQTLRQSVSVQHEATVDRMLQRLAKAGEAGQAAALTEQVDSLTRQLRTLQGRIDKLEAAHTSEAG